MNQLEENLIISVDSPISKTPNSDSGRTIDSPRRVIKLAEMKSCLVCGDKAFGYNFAVLTCESCKAFFRRNMGRDEEFQCPFEGNCVITIQSRKHCPKCRLRKCFQMGMKPERAMSRIRFETLGDKARLILGNGAKMGGGCNQNGQNEKVNTECNGRSSSANKSPAGSGSSATSTTSIGGLPNGGARSTPNDNVVITVSVPRSSLTSNSCTDNELAKRLLAAVASASSGTLNGNAEQHTIDDRRGSSCSSVSEKEQESGKRMKTANGTALPVPMSTPMSTPVREESFKPVANRFRPQNVPQQQNGFISVDHSMASVTGCPLPLASSLAFPQPRPQLPLVTGQTLPLISANSLAFELRFIKLEELVMANENAAKICNSVVPLHGSCGADFTGNDFHNLVRYLVTRVVKHHCQLLGFKDMPVLDQIALMKARVGEIILLRSATKYNTRTGQVQVDYPGKPVVTADICKRIAGRIYEDMTTFLSSFPEPFRWNDSLMLILCAVALFNADGVPLIRKDIVDSERRVYLHLLKDYLDSTYGASVAQWAYSYLVSWVNHTSSRLRNYANYASFDLDPQTFDLVSLRFPAFH